MALNVYTRAAFPEEWANTNHDIGLEYSAIAEFFDLTSYEAKLSAHPQKQAQTKPNFDLFYSRRAEALGLAIKAYEAALTVLTREAFTREHLRTGRMLGQSLLDKHDWGAAGEVYESARDAFLLLFGQGLDEDEAREVIAEAGPLFADSAICGRRDGRCTGGAQPVERRQGSPAGRGAAPAVARSAARKVG